MSTMLPFHEKNRPAWELTVICGEDKAEEMEKLFYGNDDHRYPRVPSQALYLR